MKCKRLPSPFNDTGDHEGNIKIPKSLDIKKKESMARKEGIKNKQPPVKPRPVNPAQKIGKKG